MDTKTFICCRRAAARRQAESFFDALEQRFGEQGTFLLVAGTRVCNSREQGDGALDHFAAAVDLIAAGWLKALRPGREDPVSRRSATLRAVMSRLVSNESKSSNRRVMAGAALRQFTLGSPQMGWPRGVAELSPADA